MSTTALRRKLDRIETWAGTRTRPPSPVLDRVRGAPAQLLPAAGLTPDPWQEQVLRSQAEPRLAAL